MDRAVQRLSVANRLLDFVAQCEGGLKREREIRSSECVAEPFEMGL